MKFTNLALKLHNHQHVTLTTYAAVNYDPTHTTALRNQFVRDMNSRFNKLCAVVNKSVIEEDCFALKPGSGGFAVHADVFSTGKYAFDFPRSAEKVDEFMKWFNKQVDAGILETQFARQIGGAADVWANKYVTSAYQKGLLRARQELIKAKGGEIPTIDEEGGLAAAFNRPFHIDRLGLIYSRVYSELKGITAAMDSQISRILAQGIADGLNPRDLALNMVRTITGPFGDLSITDTLGRFIPAKRRAEILARTEVIRAHHLATIQEYKNWGLEGVFVKAEWQTAGDIRVCPECADMQGKVFTLSEIENRIPLHPRCRCIALPVGRRGPGKGAPPVPPPAPKLKPTGPPVPLSPLYSPEQFVDADNFISGYELNTYKHISRGGMFGELLSPFKQISDTVKFSEMVRISNAENNVIGNLLAPDIAVELRAVMKNPLLKLERDASFYFGVDGPGLQAMKSLKPDDMVDFWGARYCSITPERALGYAGYGEVAGIKPGALFELSAIKGQKAAFVKVHDLFEEAMFLPGSKARVYKMTMRTFLVNNKIVEVPVYQLRLINDGYHGTSFLMKYFDAVDAAAVKAAVPYVPLTDEKYNLGVIGQADPDEIGNKDLLEKLKEKIKKKINDDIAKLGITKKGVISVRGQTKRDMEKILASRLRLSPHYADYEYFTSVLNKLSNYTAFGPERTLIDCWAGTSMDEESLAIFMQMVAKKEFGLVGSTMAHVDVNAIKKLETALKGLDIEKAERGARLFLREMYNNTQEMFAELGITEVQIYRGMCLLNSEAPKGWLTDKKMYSAFESIDTQPLSSFSGSLETARAFAPEYYSKFSVVMTGKVPVSRILSIPYTGYGCLREMEYVVLGGSEKVAAAYRYGEKIANISELNTVVDMLKEATTKNVVKTSFVYTPHTTLEGIKKEFKKYGIEDIVLDRQVLTPNLIKRLNAIGKSINDGVFLKCKKMSKKVGKMSYDKKLREFVFESSIAPVGQKANTLAYYSNVIDFPDIHFGKKALEELADELKLGAKAAHNIGLDVASIARHEFGHWVFFKVFTYEQRKVWQNFFIGHKELFKKVSQYSWENTKIWINQQESFSECFAAFTSPLYKSGVPNLSLPKEIEELLTSLLV